MGAPALRVSGATKRYRAGGRERTVFADLDLSVAEDEVFVLLGPSGCGKSTLLRALAGLERLSEGRIELDGRDDGRTRVGIVFQDARLLPWLTVRENVALGARYRANRAVVPAGAVETIVRDFGLEEVANAYPEALSGGQAQRAAFARTLITQPGVLLLDEPFAALDPQTRLAMQDWLLATVRRRRLAVVLVTHDLDEALRVGDHVALMGGSPGAIVEHWPLRAAGDRSDPEAVALVKREMIARYRSDLPSGTPVLAPA
jgi:ABC-type nitrate/sulfonate/bicarbonate transport system ATPase subunit